jgi:DNA gyrase subunit B
LAYHGATQKELFKKREFMEGLLLQLEANGFRVSDIRLDEEEGYYEFLVRESQNGGQVSAVNWEFLSSPELRQLMRISKELSGFNKRSYTIKGEDEVKPINDAQQLVVELMEKAKKGLTIQRYKGLGEMNPEQLWTTTMDPEKRTLLKVQIEDAVEADDIFTILMGDKVEARRDFIQSSALEVTELDI